MPTTAPHRTPLLSESSQEVVRATAAVVAANAEAITARFYPSMLAAHPELRRVFNMGNQATGEQSRALAASVVAYAVQLINPDAPPFDHVLRRIAHKHISLGIRPDQYTIVGRHLLAAVGEVLGDAVTPEVTAAWDEVYWLFATQLIAEEARLYHLAGVDPAVPVRPYRVVRRVQETAEVVSLVLEPADGQPLPAVLPGQYVSVFADLPDGSRQPRQYTVSSSRSGTRLQITVRRVRGRDGAPDGQVSSFLHDHVARTQPHRQVVVAHADRTAADHALRDAVLRTGAELDEFTALAWYEQPEPGDTTSREGFMDLSEVPLPEGVQVFTCGPLPFMRQVRATLLARGVPASAIRYEVFGPDLWGAAPEPAQPVPRQEVHQERVAV
ncbi:globin domain-containing protein [Kineococcus arenarius]|uniref:globin domain-containing protein n=1 Tax=Kineococcus sp. SYSU DK007 TaxID=3383128 RepID=UPI003D7D1C4B